MKKSLLLILATLTLNGCTSTSNSTSSTDSLIAVKDTNSVSSGEIKRNGSDSVATVPNWDYNEEVDKMTDKTSYFAINTSITDLNLSAPYDGANKGYIKIRKMRGRNEVVFQIDKGQFMSDVYGQTIKIRFDKKPLESYYCNRSADGNPTILFIESAGRFITKLKKSKVVIIEATVYQDGNQQLEFQTDGLKWNH